MLDDWVRSIDGRLRRAEQWPRLWLVALAGLLALQIGPLWYATPDGAAYLSIARSILVEGSPTRFGDPQLGFPIGYPVLIAPAFLGGALPFLSLSILHWAMAVALMLGVYRWARAQFGDAAPWLTAMVMVNVHIWILYRRTLSESAFCALLIWTAHVWNRVIAATGEAGLHRHARMLIATLLLIVLGVVREAGLVLLLGIAIVFGRHVCRSGMPWRAAVLPMLAATAGLLLAWSAARPERIAAAGPVLGGTLAGYADAALAVTDFGARLHLRMTEIGQLLVAGMFKAYGDRWLDINTLVYAPLLAAVAIGWWQLAGRRGDVLVWTAPFYAGLYLVWPYAAGTRYLLPLLPLLWACLWRLYEPLRLRRVLFAAALLAHLVMTLGYWLAIDAPRARACNEATAVMRQFATRIAMQPAAIDASRVPPCVGLLLAVMTDLPVSGAGGPTKPGWIVAPAGPPPGDGLVPAISGRGYTLYEVRPTAPADAGGGTRRRL